MNGPVTTLFCSLSQISIEWHFSPSYAWPHNLSHIQKHQSNLTTILSKQDQSDDNDLKKTYIIFVCYYRSTVTLVCQRYLSHKTWQVCRDGDQGWWLWWTVWPSLKWHGKWKWPSLFVELRELMKARNYSSMFGPILFVSGYNIRSGCLGKTTPNSNITEHIFIEYKSQMYEEWSLIDNRWLTNTTELAILENYYLILSQRKIDVH